MRLSPICGRIITQIFRVKYLLMIGFFLCAIPQMVCAQHIPGVEVKRISGPGTEPVFKQVADSMEFNLSMISGILNDDPDVKFLRVESDSLKLFFVKDSTGKFDIYIPNYRYDSIYIFTFLDDKHQVMGSYPVVLNNFDAFYSLKARVISLPVTEVIAMPIKCGYPGSYSSGCGCHFWSDRYLDRGIIRSETTEPVYQYRSPQRSLLKVRVGYSAKVEYGSPLVPGIDLHLKLDDIRE